MNAIREQAKKVNSRHFKAAISGIMPVVREEHTERIVKFKSHSPMYR